MSPPLGLRPLPYRKVARRLAEFGFLPAGQTGSHVRFLHPDGRMTVVPRHDREDLHRGILSRIIKQAGIDADVFSEKFR
ncbi:MAG: hypothetical protein QOI63_104 [Thermoplasmata archaeon]|jgi:predicted RNA binding protein YcfA (HicA-like mRNA interferase family)|nr:hypothetical protein [Thermoplasmata archaeon]